MQNFTWEIKRELLNRPPEQACCKIAACAAFLRTCGAVVYSQKSIGFEIVTENDLIAEYFISLIEGLYGVRLLLKEAITDPKRARDKLTFSYTGERASEILRDLGVLSYDENGLTLVNGILPRLIERDCCALSFAIGAFLGSGSCTLPKSERKTGYHLEFVFSSGFVAEQFCEMLDGLELIGRIVERGEKSIVYLKSKDALSDLFSLIGAQSALKKLINVTEAREESNYENRAMNCFIGNYDRTAKASADQIFAINQIDKKVGLDSLEMPLRLVALARRENPTDSMQSLAERLNISKSCLSHRLRKITEIYNRLGD